MNRVLAALMFAGVGLVGCAHSTMRGSVAMKGEGQEAHVCLGNQEVSIGDRVTLFQNKCTGRTKDSARSCEKVQIGAGEVIRLLNEHYSVVRVDPGVDFQEGTLVEKY